MLQVSSQPSLCSAQFDSVSGTAAGDPAEANWVGEAFRREDELLIGSVKGNIG
jgi:Beta-ketoacyl synthase, C-terminal domain